MIVFNASRPQELITRQLQNSKTMLTEYFEANKMYPHAKDYVYQDFPAHFTYNKSKKLWKPRKRGDCIGRIYFASPNSGEHFYLRILLTIVPGPTSFDDLKTVNGVHYLTFRDACRERGLLQEDREWSLCLEEAAVMHSGTQLRSLFVTILLFCCPQDPVELWNHFKDNICDDLQRRLQQSSTQNVEPGDEIDYGLYLIEQLLQRSNSSLSNFPGMPMPQKNWEHVGRNHLITEQHAYDREAERQKAIQGIAQLNAEQKSAFEAVKVSVRNQQGKLFFLNGPAGTGKTFVYKVLCSYLRADGIIVLCVASSGIVSLLLPGG